MSKKTSKLTPMMQQYFQIKNQYKDFILFYRLGDFYEMFFEDAIVASRELELTLTGRNCGLEERAPLCGVPFHSADGYLAKLIEKGFKVAICEQVEDPALAKGLVKREVVRVITPGTVIDPQMLDDKDNNYVMALHFGDGICGVAFSDITTGEVRATEIVFQTDATKVVDEILKISPQEILVSDQIGEQNIVMSTLNRYGMSSVTKVPESDFRIDIAKETINRVFQVYSPEGLGLETEALVGAVGGLMAYVENTQKVNLIHFDAVDIYRAEEFMVLDNFTRRNLELTEAIRHKEKRGTLLWVLDKTVTAMGGRKLRKWLGTPLLDTQRIKDRQDGVQALVENPVLLDDIRTALKGVYDLERLGSKIVYNSVNARDLVALKSSLEQVPFLQKILINNPRGLFKNLSEEIDLLEDVCVRIGEALVDDPPVSLREGGLFRSDYNETISELRDAMENGKKWILDKQVSERERTGIKSLKIGFNKVFGYYIDITRTNSHLVPEDYERKQTLANSERYITPELKEIEEKVLGAEEKLVALEYKFFVELRETLLHHVGRILKTASALSQLDVIQSFALVSRRYKYVRPQIEDGQVLEILGGRHPVVERISAHELFVPNDTYLDNQDSQFSIITGPNMAGKSTYLRQVALIVLMAQIGVFVPADSARIGTVDRIFTRVGASDDLAQGQSTFMVEMSELANILHNATHRSLVILDEIGRGTSTYDGLSIAWAVVEYMTESGGIGAKSMFATHYHELTELEGKFPGVKNFRIDVSERGEDIIFLHHIVRGSAQRSYGIQVAKLAGVPKPVVEKAKLILDKLEKSDVNRSIAAKMESAASQEGLEKKGSGSHLKTLKFVEDIAHLDIHNMTPMDAMNHLYKMAERAQTLSRGKDE